MNRGILFLFVLLYFPFWVAAQSPSDSTVVRKKSVPNALNKAAGKLSKSLGEETDERKIAMDYEELAKELYTRGEYAKAEEYLMRARQIYARKKWNAEQAVVCRELAKIQEIQGNYADAISNYTEAAKLSGERTERLLNRNDAKRLQNLSDIPAQAKILQENIVLLDEKGESAEKASAYRQMATANRRLSQKEDALENLEMALQNTVPEQKHDVLEIQNEMADVYLEDKQYDKAIHIKEKTIQEAEQRKDVNTQISQLQSLSAIYFEDEQPERGLSSLTQAYGMALEEGRTLDAKQSLELLIDYYQKEKNYAKSIELCRGFLTNLEGLIRTDSTLVDARLFQVTEERISQLEKERALKDALIAKKNTLNSVLTVSVILVFLFLLLIIRALYAIRIKNKKIALQSLRREMNPHFIFNSLNSVNQFIAQNKELEANKYLSSYSRLMRSVMENSNEDFIKLSKELERLQEYLELEQLRFSEKFQYVIELDDAVDPEVLYVPNMLIQPHLENAVWHGLRYRESRGVLRLALSVAKDCLRVEVEDDGIGLQESHRLKTANQKVHNSRGMNNVNERIRILNELYGCRISLEITEKEPPETGVKVRMCFPLWFMNRK